MATQRSYRKSPSNWWYLNSTHTLDLVTKDKHWWPWPKVKRSLRLEWNPSCPIFISHQREMPHIVDRQIQTVTWSLHGNWTVTVSGVRDLADVMAWLIGYSRYKFGDCYSYSALWVGCNALWACVTSRNLQHFFQRSLVKLSIAQP